MFLKFANLIIYFIHSFRIYLLDFRNIIHTHCPSSERIQSDMVVQSVTMYGELGRGKIRFKQSIGF